LIFLWTIPARNAASLTIDQLTIRTARGAKMPSEVRRRLLRYRILPSIGLSRMTKRSACNREKDPSWCDHAGVSYARIPHGRGDWGAGKRPAFFEFEPGNFLRLYQTAHSESTVDNRDNLAFRPIAAGKLKVNRRAAPKLTRYPHCIGAVLTDASAHGPWQFLNFDVGVSQ
jgi:hypothetical protein